MKKIILLFCTLFLNVSNGAYFSSEVSVFENEFTPEIFNQEISKYNDSKSKLKQIESIKIGGTNNHNRDLILSELQSLERKANSPLVSALILNRYIALINMNNDTEIKKFIIPIADKLYSNNMCDGYIFKGDYTYRINGDINRAIEIYKEGVKNCKIEWKNFEIIGRLNKYSYIQERGSLNEK